MRISALVLALATVGPAGLAAQAPFEGTITMARTMNGKRSVMTMRMKGRLLRLETNGDRGPMVLLRQKDGRMLAVMMSAHRYIALPAESSGDAAPRFIATGKHETVAGLDCEYYRESVATKFWGKPGDVCVTTALGFIALGTGGGMVRAADDKALRGQFGTGFFILKKIEPATGTTFEVTKIERMPVSDAMFALPAGFTEMKMGRPGA